MASLSFDPVAQVYDATRGYPEETAQRIALALEELVEATGATTFLEVGIGTGRIAVPLASFGHPYTGIDISDKMMAQLEAKLHAAGWTQQAGEWGELPDEKPELPSAVKRYKQERGRATMRLVNADMMAVPFRDHSFDRVIAVHVFHLIEEWQQAVREILRVLRPGGMLVQCWDEYGESDVPAINEEWGKILGELHREVVNARTFPRNRVENWLSEQGWESEKVRALDWEYISSPQQIVEHVAKRHWSSTWSIPDDIFEEAVRRLHQWAAEHFGDELHEERKQERRFMVCKTRV